ncbi:MAG: hypothetical protein KY476_01455 [Planctomycetes bacterium]|nr:hypothetical protein [Planctomycetota bacterium]
MPVPSIDSRRTGRSRRLCLCLSAALALTAALSVSWGQAEPEAEAQGLAGLLPEDVPRDLDFEAFSRLPEDWQEFREQATAEVARLYTETATLDVAAQRELLETLDERRQKLEAAAKEHRLKEHYGTYITLAGNLERRVDAYRAALDTLDADQSAERTRQLEEARKPLLDAAQDLRAWLRGYAHADTWTRWLRLNELIAAAEGSAPADALSEAARTSQAKLDRRPELNEEQRDFTSRDKFNRLAQALEVYLAIADRPDEPVDMAQLRELLGTLLKALERYEQTNYAADAAAARQAYATLRETAPDGGRRLSEALREHYFNFNVKFVASERFLSRLMSEERQESGFISDYILGACISGCQWTTTSVGLNLKPSNDNARFEVTLAGTTQSSTTAVARKATVWSSGYHRFWAAKEVEFDGHNFEADPATIAVDVNTATTGIRTKFSGIPLLGAIARSMARKEIARRRPQSDAITRQKIAEEVLPELNREVNKNLVQAESDLENDLYKRLREGGVYPEAESFKTTTKYLWMNDRVWEPNELGGSTPSHTRNRSGGATLHLHESFLNNMIDRMNFAGRTMTETEVRQELERYFSILAGKKVDLGSDEPVEDAEGPDAFIFAENDPIRVRIEDGVVKVVINAAFRQEGRENIPPQIVTIPLTYRVVGEQIVINRGTVIVDPAAAPESRTEQIARAAAIRQRLEKSITDRTRDRTLVFTDKDGKEFRVKLSYFLPENGWLTIWGE